MKKGISLIVLVITIIVMIVIAGAIILSLNSSNVTQRANEAALSSDRGNYQANYATLVATNMDKDTPNPVISASELNFATNSYGEWKLGNDGSVYFLVGSATGNEDAFKKAYGDNIITSYDWIVTAMPTTNGFAWVD